MNSVLSHRSSTPRKRFGQNFLRDQSVLAQIVDSIRPAETDHFVEIGPGEGALTVNLLPFVSRLDAVELDRDLIPVLKANCQKFSDKLFIHQFDVLKFDFFSLVTNKKQNLRVVGNLPYNISTPLLFYLIDYIKIINDMCFMLQREVAERLCALPNSKTYGRLSVVMQYFFEIELLLNIDKTSFYPVPKVNSSFVRMQPRCYHNIEASDVTRFCDIVRIAFTHRRKILRNCFAGIITEAQWLQVGINPLYRPEQLTVDDFVKISNL